MSAGHGHVTVKRTVMSTDLNADLRGRPRQRQQRGDEPVGVLRAISGGGRLRQGLVHAAFPRRRDGARGWTVRPEVAELEATGTIEGWNRSLSSATASRAVADPKQRRSSSRRSHGKAEKARARPGVPVPHARDISAAPLPTMTVRHDRLPVGVNHVPERRLGEGARRAPRGLAGQLDVRRVLVGHAGGLG